MPKLIKLPVPVWIDDNESMMRLCREIRDVGYAGLDTETTGKDNWMKDFVLFWSLSTGPDNRYCLSRRMLDIFDKELAGDPNITWLMSNANFDNCMLLNSGVRPLAGPVHCTLVMDWMHDENRTGRHGLKPAAKDHLGLTMREFKDVFQKQKGETYQDTLIRSMKEDPESAIDYASMDAWASRELHGVLKKKLEDEPAHTGISLWKLYTGVEVPYSKALLQNIRRGFMIDQGHLNQIRVPITEKMDECLFQFNKMAGMEVNLNSPKQLVDLFINKLGKEPIKWTTGGKSGNKQPSVDESVLNVWALEGDAHAKLLMEYRGLSKVRGTYIDGMISRTWKDGRIHPIINQHITVTGRLSSSNPNLQNIPRPDDDVWGLRGAFMPGTGKTLVAVDYRQLEMRILAHMAGDKNMQDVIKKGWDIHAGTAAMMYQVPYDDIQEAKFLKGWLESENIPRGDWPGWIMVFNGHRQDAKAVGFGQHRGRSKTCSKRGNLRATHKAIPCCAARRSVSTCDRIAILNEAPVFIRQGSHSRQISLTRQANCVNFGEWQRARRSYAVTAAKKFLGPATGKNVAKSAAGRSTKRCAARGDALPTKKRDTIKQAPEIIIGGVGHRRSITRRSLLRNSVVNAYGAKSPQFSFTIRMGTDPIPTQRTSRFSVRDATKWTCMTARLISQTSSRRYSQCPWKQGSNTINYGEGIPALAAKLGISKDEARERKEKYFEPYPEVKDYIDDTHSKCREMLEVHTLLGRKRRLLEADADWKEGFWSRKYNKQIPERPGKLAARALRQAVNAEIQGSAADIVRIAQILCEPQVALGLGLDDEHIRGVRDTGAECLLQVHDELIFEVPNENLEESIHHISSSMSTPFRYIPEMIGVDFTELAVPLDVDAGHGESWSEAH